MEYLINEAFFLSIVWIYMFNISYNYLNWVIYNKNNMDNLIL